jgi:hypothetical protein
VPLFQYYFLEGKDMSIFKALLRPSLFIIVFMVLSGACFSGGVSERKHEAKSHISTNGVETYQLSLDEVLPSSTSIIITSSSDQTESKLDPILIRVTGYSAFDAEADAKSESKRLLALRASKLDAYRSLAERVYGLSIYGKSMVKDFVLKEDRFAVALDSYIRGARVVSVNEKQGIGFETVLELMLPGNFNDCLNKVNNFKNGLNCLRPLPNTSLYLGNDDTNSSKSKSRSSTGRHHGSGYFLN